VLDAPDYIDKKTAAAGIKLVHPADFLFPFRLTGAWPFFS
jgi:hypothetical protein